MTTPSDTAHPEGEMRAAALAFLERKYVQRSDARQKAMGLQYTTAETHDLAARMVDFALSVARPQGEEGLWRPISEAPRDGTPFDAWVPDAFGGHRMVGLSFNRRGELRQHGLLTKAELPRWPTHWQPLPAPPGALSNQGKPSS